MPYHRDWSTEIITEIASWFTAHSTWTWCVVEAEFVQKSVCISQTSGRIWSLLLQYSYKWFSQGWEIPVSIERPEKPGRPSCFSAQQTSWCASSPLQHCQAVLPPSPPGTQYSSLLTSMYKRQFPLPPPQILPFMFLTLIPVAVLPLLRPTQALCSCKLCYQHFHHLFSLSSEFAPDKEPHSATLRPSPALHRKEHPVSLQGIPVKTESRISYSFHLITWQCQLVGTIND